MPTCTYAPQPDSRTAHFSFLFFNRLGPLLVRRDKMHAPLIAHRLRKRRRQHCHCSLGRRVIASKWGRVHGRDAQERRVGSRKRLGCGHVSGAAHYLREGDSGSFVGGFFPSFVNCAIGSLLSFAFEHEIVAYFMCKEVKRQSSNLFHYWVFYWDFF